MARKVLLADDSVTAQNMGRRILSDAGYEVITVNNGSAALKKIAELQPDLVILDIYMPVYSGLEVCQRLRESPETSGLPILLTVGKLEPFKAEDARRVKADGHIIKPFEATELLRALGKLEEKIVPRPQSPLSGRSSKATAAASRPSASDSKGEIKESKEHKGKENKKDSKEIKDGDWKTLVPRVPGSAARAEPAGDDERQTRESSDAGFSDVSRKPAAEISPVEAQSVEPQSVVEAQPVEPQSVVEAQPVEPQFEVESVPDTGAQEIASVDSGSSIVALPSAPEPVTEEIAASPQSAPAEPPSELSEPAEPKVELEEPAAELEGSDLAPSSDVAAQPAPGQSQPSSDGDAEVLAAIAALVNESGFGEIAPEVAVPALASATEGTGPRWTVVPMALSAAESALILEQEMEKARTALTEAVAPAAPSDLASVRDEPDPSAVPPAKVDPLDLDQLDEAKVAIVALESIASDQTGDIAHPACSGQSEPEPKPLHLEAAAAESATALPPDPAPQPTSALSTGSPEATGTQAAYAAAASAAGAPIRTEGLSGASFGEATLASAASTTPVAEPDNLIQPRQPASELASAWQSWKQIRDAVASHEPPIEVREAGGDEQTAEVASSSGELSPAAAQETDVASESEVQASAALESIVDSVLAELRPKLLEEIARKMAKTQKT